MGAIERPTLTPPFDPEAYARESESQLRASHPVSEAMPASDVVSTRTRRRVLESVPCEANPSDDALGDEFDRVTAELPPEAFPAIAYDTVLVLAMPPEQIRGAQLDHRAGFILSHVDGVSNVETILDVSGMPEADVIRILRELGVKGIIKAT